MILTNYKKCSQGLNLFITIANKVSDSNDEKKSVFGTFKIQDYVQVHKKIASSLYLAMERIIS